MPTKNKALLKKNSKKRPSQTFEFLCDVQMRDSKNKLHHFPLGTAYKVEISRFGDAVYTIAGKKYTSVNF